MAPLKCSTCRNGHILARYLRRVPETPYHVSLVLGALVTNVWYPLSLCRLSGERVGRGSLRSRFMFGQIDMKVVYMLRSYSVMGTYAGEARF